MGDMSTGVILKSLRRPGKNLESGPGKVFPSGPGLGIGDTSFMSVLARPAVRFSALLSLWVLVAAILWILLVQVLLLALNPFCHLQRPSVARVMVKGVDRDPGSAITDYVTVKQGEDEEVLRMLKAEAAELHEYDEAWILNAWYSDGLRPTQYLLNPRRLLLEYPLVLLLPAIWALWRLRKAREQAETAPPPLPPARPALRPAEGSRRSRGRQRRRKQAAGGHRGTPINSRWGLNQPVEGVEGQSC